jgi:hypothetical protein
MIVEDLFDAVVTFASIVGLLAVWFAWRVASLLQRQHVAEMMLRERLAHWKARVAREAAAAHPPGALEAPRAD